MTDVNTVTITVTAATVVVSSVDVTFDGPFDRAAARSIARAHVATTYMGQAVEVRSETKMFRFSHVDIAQ